MSTYETATLTLATKAGGQRVVRATKVTVQENGIVHFTDETGVERRATKRFVVSINEESARSMITTLATFPIQGDEHIAAYQAIEVRLPTGAHHDYVAHWAEAVGHDGSLTRNYLAADGLDAVAHAMTQAGWALAGALAGVRCGVVAGLGRRLGDTRYVPR